MGRKGHLAHLKHGRQKARHMPHVSPISVAMVNGSHRTPVGLMSARSQSSLDRHGSSRHGIQVVENSTQDSPTGLSMHTRR